MRRDRAAIDRPDQKSPSRREKVHRLFFLSKTGMPEIETSDAGSFETRASFRNMHYPTTPEEKRKVNPQRSGPASRNTVREVPEGDKRAIEEV